MVFGFPNKSRLRDWLARLAILSVLFTGVQLNDISNLSPANAADPVSLDCRSTDGAGVTHESDATKSGYYTSLASRTSDSIDGLIIRPVFAKRMYIDTSKNFDATYIAYQIENPTTTAYTNAQISLVFLGTVVKPVSHEDSLATITIPAKSGSTNGKVTAYFMVRATGPTEATQNHEVRVLQNSGTQLAGCVTGIEGVQRSLSASANKVTAISVTPAALALDQTFDVAVTGAPGLIGAGSGPDMSVMAFSPASSSSWPTMAIRLESVSFVLRGFKGGSVPTACSSISSGGVETGNGVNTIVTWTNTLAIRNFTNCANTNKHTYVATYTFRLIGSAATNPVIRPLASIASGTQVKYTGTLPSVDVSVPITTAVKPTVTKAASACTVVGAAAGKIRVPFTVTVSLSSGTTSLDKIRDVPTTPGTFVSATYIDVNKTTATTLPAPTVTTVSGRTYWDFAPTNQTVTKFVVSSTRTIVLSYTVEYPLPDAGTTSNYGNQAYALYGDVVVGSGDNVVGVTFSLTSSTTTGGCTYTPTSDPKPKEPQVITFDPPASVGAGSTTFLSAYSDSGLPVTLTSQTASDCTVSLFNGVYSVYAITEGANCVIRASQAGNQTFDAAPNVDKTIVIKKGQVISYTAGIFNTNPSTTVKVWATSKLEVSLVSVDTSVCTVSAVSIAYNATTGEKTYTITKIGTSGSCILTASQAGDTNWGPAPARDILIGVGTAQYIDFSTPANGTTYKSPDVASFSAVATARKTSDNTASGNPVYFSTSTPAVCSVVQAVDGSNNAVSGYDGTSKATTVTINIIAPGTCILAADQDGLTDAGADSGFASAAQVTKTISITGTGTTAQTLTFLESGFNNPTSKTYGDSVFNISVWSKKGDGTGTGLQVAVATTTSTVCELGSAALSGNNTVFPVKLLSAGTCTITADQAGNNTYAKATQVTFNLTVNAKELTVVGLNPTKVYDGNTTVTSWGGTATLSGVVVGDGVGEISLSGSPSGSYPDKLVGTSKNISVTGFTLGGSKTSSYTLAALTVGGEITTRPITVTYTAVTKTSSDTKPSCATSEVAITSTLSLAGSDRVTSLSCSGIPASMATAGTYPITPSSVVIKDSTEATTLTDNYSITYAPGDLVITSKVIPDLEAAETTIVYGDLLSTLSADASSTSNSRVKAKSNNTVLTGTITHRQNGEVINSELAVGTYTFDVEFVPSDDIKANYSNKQGTRTIHIIKRKLRVANVVVKDKLYDGTDYAELDNSSTPFLEADPLVVGDSVKTSGNGYGYGIKSGDTVSLSNSPTLKFASANVDSSVAVDYSNTLTGSSAGNYELAAPAGVAARIIARKLTYTASASDKIYDGLRTASVSASSVLVADPAGDGAGVLSGDDVSLTGSASGTFTSADVGSSVSVAVSGKSLTGAKQGNYSLTHPTGVSAAIIARKLTVTNITPVNKQYDGTRTATVSGTPALTALPIASGGNSDDGIVTTDAVLVTLDNGTAVYEFSSKDVGNSKTISMSGKSLAGSKAGNYTLHTPPGLTANITKRPLKFVVASHKSKFVDEADPSFTYYLDSSTSYASGESASTIGGLSPSRAAGTGPGAYAVTVETGPMADPSPKYNYDITVEAKNLYIARATITTTKAGGLVTLPGVECDCEGFKPGATVYLKMYSTPTTLDTDVVASDGTCPNLVGSIPDGSTGSHTLEITSDFPNNDPLLYSEPITLASVDPSPSPSPSPSVSVSPSPSPTVSASPSPSPSVSSSPTPSPTATQDPNQKLSVFVWLDLNGTGVQDSDEPDLPGLSLEISQAPVATALKAATVKLVEFVAGPVIGQMFAAALTTAMTDANGYLRLDSVNLGNWIIKAILPTKLNPTQDSDSQPDGQILAVINSGVILNTWMGVQGNSAISSPIYDSKNLPTNEEIEVLWEGLDEKLLTWDDVSFLRDPESGILKFTGLPAGNYRLIRVGATPSESECVDIQLLENQTFTERVITQKSFVCYTSKASIAGGVKGGSGLAATGNSLFSGGWLPLSFGLISSGSWLIYRSRRRAKKVLNWQHLKP